MWVLKYLEKKQHLRIRRRVRHSIIVCCSSPPILSIIGEGIKFDEKTKTVLIFEPTWKQKNTASRSEFGFAILEALGFLCRPKIR